MRPTATGLSACLYISEGHNREPCKMAEANEMHVEPIFEDTWRSEGHRRLPTTTDAVWDADSGEPKES